MSNFVKYKVKKDYVLIPGGFQLDWQHFLDDYPNPDCNVVFLDDRMVMMLLALVKVVRFQWLWGLSRRQFWTETEYQLWDVIEAFVADTENQLMSGCSIDSINQQLALIRGAITGEVIDLDNLPTGGVVDFSTIGLTPVVKSALEDIEDNSDDMEAIMDNVSTILGAAAVLA